MENTHHHTHCAHALCTHPTLAPVPCKDNILAWYVAGFGPPREGKRKQENAGEGKSVKRTGCNSTDTVEHDEESCGVQAIY